MSGERAGVAAPACDGMDVSPILLGKRKRPPNRFLYWESPKNGLTQAVRFGNWKAIRRLGAQELQLYDLAQDPLEQRDVSGEHPGIVSRVLAHLQAARTESPHWPTAPGTQAGKYEN